MRFYKGRSLRVLLLCCLFGFLLLSLSKTLVQKHVPATSPEENLKYLTEFRNCLKLRLPRPNNKLQSKVCADRKPWLLFVVHSAVGNTRRRLVVRSTWGSVTQYQNRSIAVVFVVGLAKNASQNEALLAEHAHWGDIVQGDFGDTYRNMTYKHVFGLDWSSRCSDSVQFVVKADDDAVVNPYRLIDHLESSPLPEHSILCRLLYGFPERKKQYKHFMTREDFALETYPRYCCGFAYVIKPRDAAALVRAGIGAKYFWVDDVYVTGMLRMRAGIAIEDLREGWGWGEMADYGKKLFGPSTSSAARSHIFHLGENVPENTYKKLWVAIVHSHSNNPQR